MERDESCVCNCCTWGHGFDCRVGLNVCKIMTMSLEVLYVWYYHLCIYKEKKYLSIYKFKNEFELVIRVENYTGVLLLFIVQRAFITIRNVVICSSNVTNVPQICPPNNTNRCFSQLTEILYIRKFLLAKMF